MTASAEAVFRDAVAAHRAGDLRTAEAGYHAVLRLAPQLLIAWDNLANIYSREDRLAELAEVHRRAIALEPSDARRYALAITELYRGRYADAWPHFEHRPSKAAGAPKTTIPEWRGEPLAGKRLLVWQEQGFGDQLQMARFVPLLDADAVSFACLAPLSRLLGQLCPTVPRLGEIPGRFDYWVSSMSLPGRLNATLDDLPPPAPLTAAPRRVGGVGVCWKAGEATNRGRSLTPDQAQDLLALAGAVSLQPEDSGAADFQETAEIIAGLDAVVTVDTAVAHLAGSLGKPTFVLLPHRSDWRWLRDRTDSPWYPSLRLIRQPEPGDWTSAIEQAKAAL
ncbi:hypothetical protein LJR219_002157 [Phenylobacterium sp. LjRoot219]|uniref:glycosyltransferase family 9 protein n=1 Tax=Phenylobacterium sp. LjRoot219 TaxID=3342283 RepID=UPI003ECC579D